MSIAAQPPRIVYVNGQYLPENEAKISVFDRGFLFADGVYEVSSVLEGKLVDNAAHMARLRRSLDALSIPSPASDEEILAIQRQIIARNNLAEGVVYLQITRGAADRDFLFPANPEPSLVVFSQAKSLIDTSAAQRGVKIALLPDLRWKRRDIKTVGLLPPSWAKTQAAAQGADDVWMVEAGEDGADYVTEGSSNNAFIVTAEGRIVTRQLGDEILHGITRKVVLELAAREGLALEERPFTPVEARAAQEAFITSASSFVLPVVAIDDAAIGEGRPGPIATRLRTLYIETARGSAV